MLAGESRDAVASVAIDAVDASGAIAAGIAKALVDIVLAIAARSPRLAAALIAADEIFAMTTKLARIRLAFVDLRLAQESVVSGVALARERIDAVDAISVMAGRALAVVDVDFAIQSGESLRAIASVSGDGIPADASVLTRSADAIVNVDVALLSGESWRTDAFVAVDHISADASVDARIGSALVNVNFAVDSSVTFWKKRRRMLSLTHRYISSAVS